VTAAEMEQLVANLEDELTELRDNYADAVRERDELQKQVDQFTAQIEGARHDLEDVLRGLS
jgi:predicted  nucleic acid-binding Zn-ribbon protein